MSSLHEASTPALPLSGVRGVLRTRLAEVSDTVWVLADQGIVSVANLATAAVVSRWGGNAELGLFGLGFLYSLFGLALARAMVWTPYTTHSPAMSSDRRSQYAGSVTAHLGMMSTVLVLAALLTAAGLALGGADRALVGLTLGLALAMPLMIAREHVRRLLLAELSVVQVTVFDAVAVMLQSGVLAMLVVTGAVSGITGLIAVGAGGLVAALWVWRRAVQGRLRLGSVRADFAHNWPLVKWMTCGAAAVQLSNQIGWSALTVLRGLAAVGELTQGYNVVRLINPILLGVSNYYAPASANVLATKGLGGLWRQAVQGTLALLVFMAIASLVLIPFGPQIAQLVFGEDGPVVGRWLIASLMLGVFSEVIHIPVEFATLALSRGRLLFATTVVRLVLSATLGVALIVWLGAIGVGLTIFAGNLISLVWQWAVLRREAAGV